MTKLKLLSASHLLAGGLGACLAAAVATLTPSPQGGPPPASR
jgi:hypothetical protein